jgi:hypothetical protein
LKAKIFSNVAEFKCLRMAVTHLSYIHKEIKSRRYSGIIATILFRIFCLHICYLKCNIKVHETIILPVILYGCEAWSLTLRERYGLRVFKIGVLGIVFGSKREE